MERKLRECVYPQLRVCPHFGPNIKKLRDQVTATWRCRIGDWRFFYSIDEGERVVFMTGAAHRSSAY
jgi:mRNA-degrading endonuclease RelE of RelBE toxin-antitoxin system